MAHDMLQNILKPAVLKRKYTKSQKNTKQMTQEEKKEHTKMVRNRVAKEYQRKSEYYKEYRRNKWKKLIYDKMKDYINEYTDDVVNDVIDEDDCVQELRKKFKEFYGTKIYYEHI